ncbi:hypothetical protein LXA43DRAFT_1141435 [Ganoderma leucocontextum]|nr:hypothetical protein LXA43DRAFT_1141435 [Ganoderma leucocontextum]
MPDSTGGQGSSDDPPNLDRTVLPAVPERSDKYYFEDGTRIFLVENTLYKLHLGLLCARFDVFNAMFAPAGTIPTLQIGLKGEGTSDNAPIVVEHPWAARKEEFDYLMEHTYIGEAENPSLDNLLAVKKLSAQWGSAAGQNWALGHLRKMEKKIPVCLRLRIGRAYEMEDWIELCFRELAKKPLTRLKPQDVEWLGLSVYVFLARVREQYHALRRNIGMSPPSFDQDSACRTHGACLKGWHYAWFMEIAKGILHPESTFEMAFWEMEDRIKEMDLTGLMGKACAAKAKAKAVDSAGVRSENTLLNQAITHLTQKVPVELLDGICTKW